MVQIVKLAKQYVIIYKAAGIPSQPDPSGDPDALTLTADLLAADGERKDLWLIHRLDRTVSGLLVYARTREAAAELSRLAAGDGIEKIYLAVTEGEPTGGIYRDYLYKDARISKAFVVSSPRKGVKEAVLECKPLATRADRTLCRVKLRTGRYHQIRVQLSSRKCPIVGDGKYGSRDKGTRTPALAACRLAFTLFGERVEAERSPDASAYPWNIFKPELSGEEI